MKKRRLLTNILYVVILLALAGFLFVEFALLNSGEGSYKWLAGVCLGIAVVAVAMVEIVFPVIDNKDMLKMTKYLVLTIVKSVLYVVSVVALFLYLPLNIIDMKISMILFVVFYFAQFFISLDPKIAKTEHVEITDDEDADVVTEETIEDDDKE